jgi:hypothetical protein
MCDDPEILALLDRPRAHDGYLPRGAVIERVETHLVLDRVDQLAQLGLQRRCLPPAWQVAFEHAELDARR